MKQINNPFKIAFFLSGSGTTLENLLEYIASHKVKATVSVVVSSRENAYGIKRAENWNIPYEVVPFKQYKNDIEHYSKEISKKLFNYPVDLIVFGGFMSPYFPDDRYINKVINIHPALIPSFSGKGYYGDRVHRAVLKSGVKITGCTIHFVDKEYDNGPIIAQQCVPVLDGDTIEILQKRVSAVEKKLYPTIIQAIVENRVSIADNKVTVL